MRATGVLTLGSLFLTVVHSSSSCEDTGCSDLFSGRGRCLDLGTLERSSVEEVSLEGCCDGDKCPCVCVSKIQDGDRAGKPCKTNKKCQKKEGICLRPGSQAKGAKDMGLCDKKTKCRCYKSTPTTTPAATTTPSTGTTSCTGSLDEKMVELLEKVDTMTHIIGTMNSSIETISETILTMNSTSSPGSCETTTPTPTDLHLIMIGGSSVGRLVETFPPSSSLSIPSLPQEREAHSLTLLPGPPARLVVCGGVGTTGTDKSCISFTAGMEAWQQYYSLKQERSYHTSARIGPNSFMIMGGSATAARSTAEIVPGGGQFDLQHDSEDACAIALEDTGEVVLTGGSSTIHGHVSRYSSAGFLGSLPDLRQGRRYHACGSFQTQGLTVLLVTGGWDGSSHLSTTELLAISSATAWTLAAPLPIAVNVLRAAFLPDGLYVAGGWDGSSHRDEVYRYIPEDGEDDRWEEVGRMSEPRSFFAMAAGNMQALAT